MLIAFYLPTITSSPPLDLLVWSSGTSQPAQLLVKSSTHFLPTLAGSDRDCAVLSQTT
jgi:hypothetical protein